MLMKKNYNMANINNSNKRIDTFDEKNIGK